MKSLLHCVRSGIILITASSYCVASDLNIPKTFTAGTTAVASEVNDNFAAVESSVDDNNQRIAVLEATIATLQVTVTSLQNTVLDISAINARLTSVEQNSVLTLNNHLLLDNTDPAKPIAVFEGINVQLTNASGATDTVNGLGNLLIGYNEIPLGLLNKDRAGSHNLVIGRDHRYRSFGGFIAGFGNTLLGSESSITGGAGLAAGTLGWATANMLSTASDVQITSPGNMSITVGNDLQTQIAGNYVLSSLENMSVTAGNNLQTQIAGAYALSSTNMQINTGADTVINSGRDTLINNNRHMLIDSNASTTILSALTTTIQSGTSASIEASDVLNLTSGVAANITSGNSIDVHAAGILSLRGSAITQE